MTSHGLKTEILVTLTLLLGAALSLGGLFMLHMLADSLLEERIRNIEFASKVIVDSWRDSHDVSFATLAKPLVTGYECDRWALYDSELRLIDQITAAESTLDFENAKYLQQVNVSRTAYREILFPRLLTLFWQDKAGMKLILPVIKKSTSAGVVDLHFSLGAIRLQILYFQKVMLIYILLYGGVLSWAGFWLLKRNIINPARMLLSAIKKVGEGKLDVVVPVVGPTEIAELAVTYNHMIEALQQSYSETSGYIDSLERTNLALKQAKTELIQSEKLASIGQLAAGVAHEIGNPLAALIGYLELLKGKEGPLETDLLQRCLNECARIDLLVQEMLEFCRPNKSNELTDVYLHTELLYCVNLLIHQGVFKNLDVDISGIESLPAISGHADKIRQVFINLLLNAVHACSGGGCIYLHCKQDYESLWCSVEDNGCGIPESIQQKIFDPFFTTKSPGQGTGLGLSVCQRIIEDFDGSIKFVCPDSGGTIFTVTFTKA